jgi:hypothetical protein
VSYEIVDTSDLSFSTSRRQSDLATTVGFVIDLRVRATQGARRYKPRATTRLGQAAHEYILRALR